MIAVAESGTAAGGSLGLLHAGREGERVVESRTLVLHASPYSPWSCFYATVPQTLNHQLLDRAHVSSTQCSATSSLCFQFT